MASYQQTVLADSPVFYLRLNEISGTTFADTTGNGHTGTANGTVTLGATAAAAGLGTAVTPGTTTSDFIGITAAAALDITGNVTLECWYKPSSTAASAYLMNKGKDDDTHASYGMFISSAGKVVFAVTEAVNMLTGTTTLSVGTWYYLVCTFTSSGNHWTIYVNAVSDNTTVNTPPAALTATVKDYRIGGVVEGGSVPGTFFPMLGSIDEIALYNVALTSTQISNHYAARNNAAGSTGTSNLAPPGQAIAALAHERNQQRKEQEQPGHRFRLSDYYRRHRG